MRKWYKGIYRRQLTDMHINDDRDEYLSLFDAEKYFGCLKKAHIQSPMIYLQSHTGLCNYPTKVARTHAKMQGENNGIKQLVGLCKADGMKVVGYYSLIFNNVATDLHPEWTMRYADGSEWRDKGQRYGLCCPNNTEYRKFVKENVKELSEYFTGLDGIFYDMPYWEVPCACEACKKRFKKETGKQLPLSGTPNDEDWLLYIKKRQEWMVDFVRYVKKLSVSLMPKTTVEFNFAAVIGCDWLGGSTEGINEQCEFTGGDLYGDLYSHSFAATYYYGITENQPFEYMTCRCDRNLREHTITKPQAMLNAEIMLTLAHHGATLNIDAINPDGTLDERVYEKVGKAFEKQIPYEKYADKGEMYADVAVYFDSKTMFSEPYAKTYNKLCAANAYKTLTENHIGTAVIANTAMNDLGKYKAIIAPCLQNFDNDEPLKFIDYVKNGGILYLSGRSDERLMKEFFGAKFRGYTYGNSKFRRVYKGYEEVQAYINPQADYKEIMPEFNEKYPLPIVYKLPIYELKGNVKGTIVLPYTDPDDNRHYASIHSNPPGVLTDIPAIAEVGYGKGKVIWTAALIENDGRTGFKDIFANIILKNVTPKYEITASKFIESVVFEDGDDVYVSFASLDPSYEKIERTVKIKIGENGVAKILPNNKKVPVKNGTAELSVTDFEMIKISQKSPRA